MEHLAAVRARIASIEALVQGARARVPTPASAQAGTAAAPAPTFQAMLADALREPVEASLASAAGLHPPVDAPVSSGFGMRAHPLTGERRHHAGVDFAAPAGTPVRAVAAGVVEFAGERGGYGNLVVLRHADGLESRYAHQREFAVRPGQRVEAGGVLGTVGSTGDSTGPHLHLELRRHGVAVDPLPLLGRGARRAAPG